MQINHINGDPADNRVENLEYVTPSQNVRHRFVAGRPWIRGSQHGNAKLNEELVGLIKEMLNDGWNCATIARNMSGRASATTIEHIKHNKIWKHVPWPDEPFVDDWT